MFALQRELHTQQGQRLLAVVHVKSVKAGKLNRRANKSLLCLTVKDDVCTLQKVKVDGGKHVESQTYDTRQTWELTDLEAVDAIDTENKQFTLTFTGKQTRWQAFNVAEKTNFLFILWKICGRYIPDNGPTFEHFDISGFIGESRDEDDTGAPADGSGGPAGGALAGGAGGRADSPDGGDHDGNVLDDLAEPKVLTAQQEDDINAVLAGRDWSQSDAHEYTTALEAKLAGIEGENIRAIIASDRQVVRLMNMLDDALDALGKVEENMTTYDTILSSVKTDVDDVADQADVVALRTDNENKLLSDVDALVSFLDFPESVRSAMAVGDLSNMNVLKLCIEGVQMLQGRRISSLAPGLESMAAIEKHSAGLKALEDEFANRMMQFFLDHLNVQIKQQTVHESRRRRLDLYAPLMRWLKGVEPLSRFSRFSTLCQAYASALCPVYAREMHEATERCKTISGLKGKGATSSGGTASNAEVLSRRLQFDSAVDDLLRDVLPVRVAEQDFCKEFFASETPGGNESDARGSRRVESTSGPQREIDILLELFKGTDKELIGLADVAERQDPFNTLSLMMRLEATGVASPAAARTTMLGMALAGVRDTLRRKFKEYVAQWTKIVGDSKVPVKKKFGILPACERFTTTMEHMEKIVQASAADGSRQQVDDAMVSMAETVLATVRRIAADCKHTEVVVFENCYYLKDRLAQLKIECLKPFRDTVGVTYKQSLQNYVSSNIEVGKPMERLSTFFEGVEGLINAGTAAVEVGFQMSYSKHELRKVIALYPGKEVKKNLEAMYKRVDRHLCDETNLLVVVWRSIQEEFLKQYQRFDDLITRCYPGSSIHLEFDVNDLLSYFVTIAKSN